MGQQPCAAPSPATCNSLVCYPYHEQRPLPPKTAPLPRPVSAAPMSIQVYIGHTGHRLSLDTAAVTTVEALRSWLAQHADIQPRNQIVLTPAGRQIRTQTLLTETELFVFDSSQLSARHAASPSSSGASSSHYQAFDPGSPPDTLTDHNDLQAWQNLFRLRKSWAVALLNGCGAGAKQAERYQDEQAVIERSLGVAVASLQQHVKGAEQKYENAESWAEELLQEPHAHVASWESHLDSLRSIPARAEFKRFMQHSDPKARPSSAQNSATTLQGFVDVASTRKAAATAKTLMDGFADKLHTMRHGLEGVSRESDALLQAVEQLGVSASKQSASEPSQLLEEIGLVVKKLASDLERVTSLPKTSTSVSQASKLALLHTRNFLPALTEHCAEMNELVQRTRQKRDAAAQTAQDHMRTLSAIESRLSEIYAGAKNLDMPKDDQEAFAALSTVSRLPSVYGQLLVESVRRREWVAKMRRDSATLQEEVATYQEEEDKRRKRWIRSVDDVASPEALQSHVLGIELSLRNEGGSWPQVTREELAEYLKTLTEVYGEGPVTEEIDQAIKDLDKPTRKQIKHARAFKNGSMHEAAFGDTSLLLRGDEQHKTLRETNARLEEDLRAQKSRVRKLEDLLHRQSTTSRTGTADLFTPQSAFFDQPFNRTASPILPSPQPSGELSRETSGKQRRLSSAQATEEKKLARRVVDLEAELQAHKDDAASRKNSDAVAQRLVEEANSTKRDLMENMEAQQREFASERRTLERELVEAKERVEELENEIDRLMGSRDDERTGADARMNALQDEVARLKDDALGHAARAATEQDARAVMERKLEVAEAARADAEAELRRIRAERESEKEAEAEQLQVLAAVHNQLAPEAEAPDGLGSLAAALEELVQKSAAQAKELADTVAFAKAENASLWTSNERQKTELSKAAEKLSETEEQVRHAEESFSAAEAKAESLQQRLREEQDQLRSLREKFAEGETGSEVLRQRISEEEARAGKLTSELAEARSHINSMDVELMRMHKKHKAYHTSAEASAQRLEKRAERAKEVSQRLYTTNARLSRLLEQLGLVLTYREDGTMHIDRASKMAASTTISELSDPVRPGDFSRTTSLTSPPPTRKVSAEAEDPMAASLAHWSDAATPEEEAARFEAYLQHIARFNIDYFSEQVHKRSRDYEYTAKKFHKEARESGKRADAYKERAQKLRRESHSKIAVKDFKEGDLALFLPTRGQTKGTWAAFNINCPHYFLAEREGMRLGTRDFIVARIQKVEQKVVDLSRSNAATADGRSLDDAISEVPDDDNPFELSDGLTWWMVHATEERGPGAGAPSTPGLGKSTVAAANVDAKGSVRVKRGSKGEDASKVLGKSLDSRRSSSTSNKKGAPMLAAAGPGAGSPSAVGLRSRSESQTSLRPPPAAAGSGGGGGLGIITDDITPAPPTAKAAGDGAAAAARSTTANDQVRTDLLFGP